MKQQTETGVMSVLPVTADQSHSVRLSECVCESTLIEPSSTPRRVCH